MNRFSTSPFDGTRSPAPRPHRAPRAVVAVAIALALLVIAALADLGSPPPSPGFPLEEPVGARRRFRLGLASRARSG